MSATFQKLTSEGVTVFNRLNAKKVISPSDALKTQNPIKGDEVLCFCDLTGARTLDPLLKREMLYQLSYQISNFPCGKVAANIVGLSKRAKVIFNKSKDVL